MSNIGISPDQINQQKQMLEGAAQLAHQRDGINYEGRKKGSKRQLITTIVVVVAIVAVLVLLSVLGNQ